MDDFPPLNHAPSENQTGSARPAFTPLTLENSNSQTGATPSEDFRARAKGYEPAALAIWNVPNGIAVKILRNRVLRVTPDEETADDISEQARMSPESLKAAKEATARVLARRCQNEEAADMTIIAGCAAELAYGFYSCLQAIKGLEQKLLSKKNVEEKKK